MRAAGKFLQLVGLMALPIAMAMELSGFLGRTVVSHLVIMTVFGVAAFVLGRMVEGYSR